MFPGQRMPTGHCRRQPLFQPLGDTTTLVLGSPYNNANNMFFCERYLFCCNDAKLCCKYFTTRSKNNINNNNNNEREHCRFGLLNWLTLIFFVQSNQSEVKLIHSGVCQLWERVTDFSLQTTDQLKIDGLRTHWDLHCSLPNMSQWHKQPKVDSCWDAADLSPPSVPRAARSGTCLKRQLVWLSSKGGK